MKLVITLASLQTHSRIIDFNLYNKLDSLREVQKGIMLMLKNQYVLQEYLWPSIPMYLC